MTEKELRNGITAIEAVKMLDLEQAYVTIKDVNNNEIDRYWYRNDCFHNERISDNYKVLTLSLTTELSIVRLTLDPHIILTVDNIEAK